MEVAMAASKPPAAPARMSYVDIFQLLHSEDSNKTAKLVAEYEAVRADIKENGASGDESSGGDEDDDSATTPTRSNSSGSSSRRHPDKPKRSFSQMSSDDRPYPRGRIPAGSGRQPRLKKSKLMQKITGRKNARPVPMPGMS
ncbi:hypothetical protein H310_12253 [Aphanomyces invadans]|uniref:Uncharacterized protein n=1 Tax=Aphanomyces invadans TaxID=157072 RepID=A0A024TIX8_9STRA|nr:hypothetical protein H310_12253 [Aphanomyces invadans]ETV93909.1 hypothetical protein H310_12253 [Aphanomyces invadans]|eukprot:XP_008877469.1 hypothetical protein H310_12253 [Aphanomyces invadans]